MRTYNINKEENTIVKENISIQDACKFALSLKPSQRFLYQLVRTDAEGLEDNTYNFNCSEKKFVMNLEQLFEQMTNR